MDRTTLIDLSWAFNFLTDDLQIAKLPDYQYLIFVQSYLINSRKQKPKLLQAINTYSGCTKIWGYSEP